MLTISQEAFHGPMDLLLHLVQQAKVDLYEIEISTITEEFLQVMQEVPIPADELSDFIHMASYLVLMKARLLLHTPEEEEELSREEFIARLQEYRVFRQLSALMRPMEERGKLYFVKRAEDPSAYRKEPPETLEGTGETLTAALFRMVARRPKMTEDRPVQEVLARETFSEDQIARRIRTKIKKGDAFTFFDLFDPDHFEKGNVIGTFLVLLELARRDAVFLQPSFQAPGFSIALMDRSRAEELLDHYELMDPTTQETNVQEKGESNATE